jgi:tetratricopeptide (TPR) repeat protein
MKQKIKKFLSLLLPFILGLLLGVGGMTLWAARSLQFIVETTALSFLAYENKEATDQYLYPSSIDSSIYAMQHLIKFKDDFYRKNINQNKFSKTFLHDLAVAYIRLGNLYEKKGDMEKAAQNFNKGFEIALSQNLFDKWKGTEKEIKTIHDFKKFVTELDNRLQGEEK